MATYLITYDLESAPDCERTAIRSAIMTLGDAWARPLADTWYVRTSADAESIQTVLEQVIGKDGTVLVHAVSTQTVLKDASLRWFRRRDIAAAPSVATRPSFALSARDVLGASRLGHAPTARTHLTTSEAKLVSELAAVA